MAKIGMIASDLESFKDLMDLRFDGLNIPKPSNEALNQVYEFIHEIMRDDAEIDIYDIVIYEFNKNDINENIKEAQSLLGIDNYSMLHGFIDAVQSKGYEFIPSQYYENGFIITTW